MSDWLDDLIRLERSAEPGVLISVAAGKGSIPREVGTKMIVTRASCLGTIGGGHLEYKAIEIARTMLIGKTTPVVQRFPLGPSLGQCCGGVVDLLFEPLAAATRAAATAAIENPAESVLPAMFSATPGDDFHIALFGAGHVGKALIQVLSLVSRTISWIDSRDDVFPAQLPTNVNVLISDEPEYEVDDIPAASYVLIMTHSHPLDQAICERALARDDLAYCGLIGSATKLSKFRKRLLLRGLTVDALTRLTCPIGVPGIEDKHPGSIAIAVAAQLLQVREQQLLTNRSIDKVA